MWPFDPAPDQTGLNQEGVGQPADQSGWGGMFSPGSFLSNPDFRRHAAYDALTNAGLGLIAASAPSSTPTNLGTMFGSLAGGAAQGVQSSADRYMKMAQAGMQMQNMQMRQRMMQGVLNAPDPSAAPQAAAEGGPVAPAQQQTGALESGNNPTAVNPTSGAYGKYQFMPETWAGVAAKHPDLKLPFNMKQATPEQQDAAKAALDQDNGQGLAAFNIPPTPANLYLAHRFGVGGAQQFLNQPDDVKLASFMPKSWIDQNADLQGKTVGQFKGKVGRNFPGTQLAQAQPPMPQGGDQQPTGNQPGVMPAPPQGGLQLPPPPQAIPIPKQLNAMLLSGDKGMEAMAKSKIAQINTLNSNAMGRWKANVALLQHNQTVGLEKQKMEQTERNSKVTQAGPNNELATAETNIESAKERGKEEERTRFVYGSQDWANKTPEELRKQVNPEALTLVDAIQNGQALSNIATRAGGSGGMDINKNDLIAIGTKIYGKSFDTNYGEQKKEFAVNMAPGKDGGKQLASISNATQHITDAAEAYNEMKNGKYPLANRIFNAAKTASGWGPEKGFDAIMQPVATEMAKVISGSSDNSVTEREALREITAAWGSPEQMQTVFNKYAGLAQKRLNTKYAEAKVYGYDKEYIDKRLGEYGAEALAKIPTSINLEPPKAAAPGNRPPLSSFQK